MCHDIHYKSFLKKKDSILSYLSEIRLEDVILLRRLKFVVLTPMLSLNFKDFYVLSLSLYETNFPANVSVKTLTAVHLFEAVK